ncbi:MAG TPA: glycosyltransferase family 4 protein [Burkholderiaceae bacterium]|nr:glycosyltransferase family 4 protein [Burkholderiaceae bacterium]
MTAVLLAAIVAAGSIVLTGLVRRYALARSLLDHPNARTSHVTPTPRGGGVAIVVTFCAAVAWLAADGKVAIGPAAALIGAGGWVALVGFVDDHRHVPAGMRLCAHFIGAAWALAWLGGLPPLPAFGTGLQLGWFGHVAAALFLVWMLNLYNFMDGIDAIAGIEAITVALGGAALWWLSTSSETALAPALLAAAAAGFLVWNFPPARIFMGDAGSGFLGLMLGVFAVWSAHEESRLFWSWLILPGVFVVDATLTLIRRVLRGERFYEAHRSHAYQHASRRFGQHRIVALAVGAINVAWLLPIAALVAFGKVDCVLGLLIAYAPLVWLAVRFKAGEKEKG